MRKLLIDIPHKMHWNSFRFRIGPVPEKWLDIADEAGLLIENEYCVWTGTDSGLEATYRRPISAPELIGEYSDLLVRMRPESSASGQQPITSPDLRNTGGPIGISPGSWNSPI